MAQLEVLLLISTESRQKRNNTREISFIESQCQKRNKKSFHFMSLNVKNRWWRRRLRRKWKGSRPIHRLDSWNDWLFVFVATASAPRYFVCENTATSHTYKQKFLLTANRTNKKKSPTLRARNVDHAITDEKKSKFRNWKWKINFV